MFKVFDKDNTGEINIGQVYDLINKFDEAQRYTDALSGATADNSMNIGGGGGGPGAIGSSAIGGGAGIGMRGLGTKNTSGTSTTGSKSPTKKPTNGGNTLGIGL